MENPTRRLNNDDIIIKKLNQDKSTGEANKEEKKENIKQLLIAHKIDLKDKKNNYYKKGVNEIYNNENIFFSYKYNNQKIKIGNSEQKFFTFEPLINSIKKNIGRKKNYYLSTKSNSNNQIKDINANTLKKDKLNDSNMSAVSRYDYRRQTNSNTLKRPPIFFKDRDYITDGELKIIFQNIKKNIINNKNKSRNENNIFINNNNTDNKTITKEINDRINLQEKIMSDFEIYKKNSNSLIKRLKKYTKKEKNNLLINQLDNYRYKLQKINNISKKLKNYGHFSNKIQWLSSLRTYNKNQNKNNTLEKIGENELHTYTNNTNKNFNNTSILDNYINKYHYSFGYNSTLYSDIESKISPLCALILPENQKNINKEIIKKKNVLPCIKGKNLLEQEIEISKQLEGKRKLLLKNSYTEDDIKPILLANSKSVEKFKIPKVITNTFDLHFN